MTKERPRLTLGPEGAKPKTQSSQPADSRISFKERDEEAESRYRDDDDRGSRGRGRRNDGRESQADFGLHLDKPQGRRSSGPGGERSARGPGGDRGPRSPGGDRGPRSPGGERSARGPGGDRGPRGPGGERSARGPGGERGPRSGGDERGNRGPGGGERSARGPGGDRGPRRDSGEPRGPVGGGERDGNRQDPWSKARPKTEGGPRRDGGEGRSYRDDQPRRERPQGQGFEGQRPPRRDLQPSDNGSPWPKARAVHLDAEQVVEPALAVEPRGLASDERKIHGVNACALFYQHHADLVIRGYFTEATARAKFGPLMKTLATAKKAYHVITTEEMDKVTDSTHHEGVCLVIKELPSQTLSDWLANLAADAPACVLLLDGVANPHNLGAIMRTAAHYKVGAIITENSAALRSGAAMRTSEGGALFVPGLATDNLVTAIEALKAAGFTVYATAARNSSDLYRTSLPSRTAYILGEEQGGVSDSALAAASSSLTIAGSGLVDSLNVSVAAALLSAEYWRQHQLGDGSKAVAKPAKAKAVKAESAAKASKAPAKAKAVTATAISTDLPEIPPVQELDLDAVAPAKVAKPRASRAKAVKAEPAADSE